MLSFSHKEASFVKEYLQPAATLALAFSIASLGFTLPNRGHAEIDKIYNGSSMKYPIHVKLVDCLYDFDN